jgi:hypothetical protein
MGSCAVAMSCRKEGRSRYRRCWGNGACWLFGARQNQGRGKWSGVKAEREAEQVNLVKYCGRLAGAVQS